MHRDDPAPTFIQFAPLMCGMSLTTPAFRGITDVWVVCARIGSQIFTKKGAIFPAIPSRVTADSPRYGPYGPLTFTRLHLSFLHLLWLTKWGVRRSWGRHALLAINTSPSPFLDINGFLRWVSRILFSARYLLPSAHSSLDMILELSPLYSPWRDSNDTLGIQTLRSLFEPNVA